MFEVEALRVPLSLDAIVVFGSALVKEKVGSGEDDRAEIVSAQYSPIKYVSAEALAETEGGI